MNRHSYRYQFRAIRSNGPPAHVVPDQCRVSPLTTNIRKYLFLPSTTPMSSKRKWDEPEGDESPSKAVKIDDGKTATEAAAAAAAIAAKIAAQYAGGAATAFPGKDPHDADYTHDIDINDVRNRYMLTKGSTQQQIHDETGASVSTKGTWYPDRAKATEKDPPLYLHISASTREVLQSAIDKVNELINTDLGPLVEDKSTRLREKRKWPEEKLPIELESIRNFNVRAKVVGPSGQFVKYIQQETGTRVQIKGLGSGFVNQETGREEEVPMYIHVTGPDESQVARAKVLTEDLLEVVRAEHGKVAQWLQEQQMELHRAQMQYASYATAYTVRIMPGSFVYVPSTLLALTDASFLQLTGLWWPTWCSSSTLRRITTSASSP
ncbi:hypothetical protein OE88DRAFT_424770 [Heliocybe sulcata]|uniref:K Homology domain-containing protein n=1 Tax=Heliocybe sulcata TaxID=5364 RepID=A0A5C3MVB5_9AGAM|nr:hypothetical protein OE88DRAFT_424770 [Heliocybe sulcata]